MKALFAAAVFTCLSAAVQSQELKTEITEYGDGIIRVVKYPSNLEKAPSKISYSVVALPVGKSVGHGGTLVTSRMTAKVDDSGNVAFYTPEGEMLLKELDASMTLITEGADKGSYKIRQSYLLDAREPIFGLGQRKDIDMMQNGKDVEIWSTNTNITIPYFTSRKGYGLYWDNAGLSRFVDSRKPSSEGTGAPTSFSSEVSSLIDYYFIYRDGTQDGVISGVRQLSGQATMFPLWTMGFWQCRERYKSSDELCEVVDRHRELGIPLDGIVQDWQYWGCNSNWNAMKFLNPRYINKLGDPEYMRYLPDGEQKNWQELAKVAPRIKSPEDMIEYVHKQNAHLMISIWASFGPWTDQYAELKEINALLPFETWPHKSGVRPYDAFNPKAREIYWKYLRHLYDMGIDAWWSDSTEPDHVEKEGDRDYKTYDGTWLSVKNAYPLVTNLGIYEHQRKAKGGNDKRAFQLTRCGAFGLQRSAALNWSGDIRASWEEFRNQIPSGLNYTLCGLPYWNTDIGGFFYWNYKQTPQNPAIAELQTRWMQWGAFLPVMRNHCSSPMVSEIYLYGEAGHWAYDAMVKAVKMRYRILPYTYSQCGAVVQQSETMMRPFIFDFPQDDEAIRRNDEYMFGHSILVHPVTVPLYTYCDSNKEGHLIYPDVKAAAAPVQVYLPESAGWYDFYTNTFHKGGREVQRLVPIDIIPLFVKAGSILPLGPDVQYAGQKPWDNLEVRIYPGADADYVFYEDEGDNYNYEKGQFTLIRFHWNDASRELTIGERSGKFKGMLQERNFNLVLVDENTPSGESEAQGKVVRYSGRPLTVKL